MPRRRVRRVVVVWLCFVLLWAFAWGETPLDLRASYPLCPAWTPYEQGACASCCAAALATVVAARECLEYGRASRYAMTQIWDCAADGACDRGSNLLSLIDALGENIGGAFLPAACAPPAPQRDSNQSLCGPRFAACSRAPTLELRASLFFDLVRFAGPPLETQLATQALMRELQTYGPVISVLRLVGQSNIAAFRAHDDALVFAPQDASDAWISLQHCVVVYGWGVAFEWDSQTASKRARPFWRVQNSYGTHWGANGTGRILRGVGLLEGQWRSPHMAPHPCVANDSECGRLPYANYTPINDVRAAANARPDNWSIIGLASGVVVVSVAIAGLCLYREPSRYAPRYPYYEA